MSGNNTGPLAPTASLPPVTKLSSYTTSQITDALNNVRELYFPPAPPPLPQHLAIPKRRLAHLRHDESVPDSGYASAEDEDDSESESEEITCLEGEAETELLDLLRADTFERSFAIKWLTSFVGRCAIWVDEAPSDDEWETRNALLDEASSILSRFNSPDEEDEEALTRTFSFPSQVQGAPIEAELNDAPLSNEDHTSVGLQSWGSSILLAERMCLDPARFSLVSEPSKEPLRILELGAGTGLLSIIAAKLLQGDAEIVATDYHPDVLSNLRKNVETNFPSSPSPSPHSPTRSPIEVHALDWESPTYTHPLHAPFDIILAADVIYHPAHAEWIKSCVENLLAPKGVFWLIIPVRSTGRHEGMHCTVDALFPLREDLGSADVGKREGKGKGELVVVTREEFARKGGVGRADEGGYKLYEIGWAG